MTGWEGSTRRARLPGNWPAIRQERLRIDGFRCTFTYPNGGRCPEAATDVDHVQAMTDDHRLEALASLCRKHHARKSAAEGGRAFGAMRRQMAAAKYRRPESHPGIREPA